jgi:hypothetical protein
MNTLGGSESHTSVKSAPSAVNYLCGEIEGKYTEFSDLPPRAFLEKVERNYLNALKPPKHERS